MTEEEFNTGFGTYIAAHYTLSGWSMDTGIPMPPTQPENLPSMTFAEYLEALGIGYLRNIIT